MMRVQVIGHDAPSPVITEAVAGSYDGWRPRAVLGAASAGALLLPDAKPTSSTMYGPRGVWIDDERTIVADTGNHRLLIWAGHPTQPGTAASVVLGQASFTAEGPAAGGADPTNGMYLPTGVVVHDGRLVVCDAWHHRLLIWDTVPGMSSVPPDHVIGQANAHEVEPNAGRGPGAASFYWPFGIAMIDGRCYVADTGNRRVLVWKEGLPSPGQPADIILGQPTPQARDENRGAEPGPDSFRWPHAIAPMTDAGRRGVWIADAGNHRLLGWSSHPDADSAADRVLGQPDFSAASEFPYVPQVGRLRFPYGMCATDHGLAVADTANNRVLLQSEPIEEWSPTLALAQPDLAANGENRWQAVGDDTLCWPYGLAWHRTGDGTELIAVADSGNNRVVLWERA